MSASTPNHTHDGESERRPKQVARSTFLSWLGLGGGALTAGAMGFLGNLLSSAAALAASKPRLAISTALPTVSKKGLYLGSAAALKNNSALAFTDPKTGDPAILIRLASGQLVSYDMVCPHRGCTVPYDPARQLLVCPCHGATFDPVHGAAPLSGPVNQPLFSIPIRVDSAGKVYALDSKPGTIVNRLRAAPTPSRGGEDDGGSDDGGSGTRHHHGDG